MKIALAGAKSFAMSVLEMLQEEGHEVVLVACEQTDKLWVYAHEAGVDNVKVELVPHDISVEGVELIIGAHYKRWIEPTVIERARYGAIGYHPSLLPRHRGGDAVRWTTHMRDPVAGGTVYLMEDRGGADTGPILIQEWCLVRPNWSASDLWREELFSMGIELLREATGNISKMGVSFLEEAFEQDELLATWEPTFDRPPLKGAP
jgi:methionyl-tRNA formyltransferase